MNVLAYASRALRREFRDGDLLTLFAALVLGVAAMTAVATLVDRVQLALAASAAEVIGGDLGVRGREDPPQALAEEAARRGLRSSRTVSFSTVLFQDEASQMATIKAVDAAYPLRGQLRVARDGAGLQATIAQGPPPGQAYADARILEGLGLGLGDWLELGAARVQVSRLLLAEPDAAGGVLEMSPPLLVNRADVDASGLLGPGSRASYRLMFAGAEQALADFRPWLESRLDNGLRLVSIDDSQQGLRTAFDRAGRFLALAALLAVLLAGVATTLAANRFALRRTDTVAVLRCLGAHQGRILASLALQLVLLAIPACALGVALGMAAQLALVQALGSLLPARLPLPQAAPVLSGAGIGLLLLLGFGLAPLLRLRGVPPMRVLNRSFAPAPAPSLLAWALGLAAALGLAVYATGDLRLALWVLGGLAALAVLAAAAGALLLWLLRRLQARLHGPWRLGLAALGRRRGLAVVQLVGLSLSLCALLLLAVIGPGLLSQWRQKLPADTPNHFLLNVQREQAGEVAAALRALGVAQPDLQPFGTGRLLAINGQPPRQAGAGDGEDDANRPLNFSWRHDFPPANTLTAGRYWEPGSAVAEASVEEGWASRYGVKVGDTLTLQLADQARTFTVTSLRKADWDSFRVNFFVLLNAGAVGDAPYNLISAFHLPKGGTARLGPLVRQFPNLSVLEIDAILARVREVIERVAQAVQLVMGFSLAAGVLVLLAALQATAAERRYGSAVLRTLGAGRAQLRGAVLVEFGALGLLAAVLAVAGAAIIGTLVSRQLFELALTPPWPALIAGGASGMLLSMLAGWSGTRAILRTPPMLALRQG